MINAYLVLGLFLLLLAGVDIVWTTLWVDGSAGPLSSRLTTFLWQGLKTMGGRHSRTLSLAGPLTLLSTLVMWVVLLWAGWTFFLAGDASALVDTRDYGPITWPSKVWYVAYTMFTVGNGDFTPKDGFWQIASSLMAASGMTFITFGVTYVLSVLGSVAQKRSFASGVTGLGYGGEALVERGWDGSDFRSLELPLSGLASQLDRLADQHNTFPILHYYHSEREETASAVAVAVLDEALTVLLYGIPEDLRPNAAVLQSSRSSVESYLQTLNSAFIKPAEKAPPPPDLGLLRSRGIPTVSDEVFTVSLERVGERRRKLLGMLEADAWQWPQERMPEEAQ